LGEAAAMTTFTMRRVGGVFVVTGPDIEPKKFKTRREAKDWCKVHYPGSPIREIVPLRKAPDWLKMKNSAAPAVKREAATNK
jgi:hypothetical protein